MQSSVDRVLQSGTLRNSPSSRRLLKYLADHSQAGDAEQLKEYTIGVDAFGIEIVEQVPVATSAE